MWLSDGTFEDAYIIAKEPSATNTGADLWLFPRRKDGASNYAGRVIVPGRYATWVPGTGLVHTGAGGTHAGLVFVNGIFTGGTSTALTAVDIGVTVQAFNSGLTSIAALTTTAAGRSVLTFADPNADRLLAWDDSAGTGGPIALADIATEGSPAAGDFLIVYLADGSLAKVDWDDLPGAAVADGDYGHITVSGGVWEVDDNALTVTKLAQVAALTVLGNATNATADVSTIGAGTDGFVLRRSGTELRFGTVATAGIAPGAVTDAKLRDSAALSVIGRSANSTGGPADVAAASDGEVLRRSGAALGFGTVATAGIADDAVTNAKAANMAEATIKGRAAGAGTGDPTDLTVAQVATALKAHGEMLGHAYTATDESTTSAGPVTLATDTTCTVDTGETTDVEIDLQVETYNTGSAAIHTLTIEVDGTDHSFTCPPISVTNTIYQARARLLVSLTTGSKVIRMQVGTNAGTARFLKRSLTVTRCNN